MRNPAGRGAARYRGRVAIEAVFETHSTTEGHAAGRATQVAARPPLAPGTRPGRLTRPPGPGRRRHRDGITAVVPLGRDHPI